MKQRFSGERGQSVLEFVVIFPFVMLFLFSIADFGVAVSRRATMQHAVREGARYAATLDNSDNGAFVRNRTAQQAQDLIDPDADVTICFEDLNGDGDANRGEPVDVKAHYEYKPFVLASALNFVGASIPEFDLSTTGSARMEVNASGMTPC